MGRVLSNLRHQAAIDLWRERFNEIIAGQRVTMKALAAVLRLDLSTLSAVHLGGLVEARKTLADILASSSNERAAALNTWFGRYLVERGPHLLVTLATRQAVLASVRDSNRRLRNASAPNRKVTLQVPIETARRLRRFAGKMDLPTDGEAIDALLDRQQTKPRRTQKAVSPPRPSELDLLSLVQSDNNN